MTDTPIRTTALTKDYGSGHGVFDLDLEIHRGEIFGFLGPNGSGKSTTMRMLLDLITPTAGAAVLLGLDSHAGSLEIRRRVGYLPGDFALYPKLTGTDLLDYLADLRGGVRAGVRDALAERFGAQLDRPIRGTLALALAAATGRKAIAAGGAAAYGVLAFLVNGFAPLIDAISWLQYLFPFYYYDGHDPLSNGIDIGDLAVLAAVSLLLTATAMIAIRRRDLRG